MIAQDGGIPSKSTLEFLTVLVSRNLHAPTITTPLTVDKCILENHVLSQPLYQVKAKDDDTVVSVHLKYFAVCDNGSIP